MTLPTLVLGLSAPPAYLQTPSTQSSIQPFVPRPTVTVYNITAGSWTPVSGMLAICSISLSSGSGLSIIGATTASTPAVGVASTSFGVSVSGGLTGGWGAIFSFTVSCTLPSSVETLPVASAPIALILPRLRWITAPPPSLPFNTPWSGIISANLSYADPNATQTDLNDWAALGLVDGDILCTMSALRLSGLSVNPFVTQPFQPEAYWRSAASSSNATLAPTLDARGRVSFPQFGLTPPSSSEGKNVTVVLSCSVRGQLAASIAANVTIAKLAVEWVTTPPATVVPTTLTEKRYMSPQPAVLVRNIASGANLSGVDAAGVSCTMSIASASSASLVGTTSVPLGSDGRGVFDVGVDAGFGVQLVLTVTCVRTQGGLIAAASAPVSMEILNVAWVARPPSVVLYRTPFNVSLITTKLNASSSASQSAVSSVQCTISVETLSTATTITFDSGTRQSVSSDAQGIAVFFPSLMCSVSTASCPNGIFGLACPLPETCSGRATGLLLVTCSIAGKSFLSETTFVSISAVTPFFVTPPPLAFMPATAITTAALVPAPVIGLRIPGSPLSVDTTGVVCDVGPPRFDGAYVFTPASGSYSFQGSAPTLTLDNIQYSAQFGQTVNMTIICRRAQGDNMLIIWRLVRILNATAAWAAPFPSSVANSVDLFSVLAYVTDLGLDGYTFPNYVDAAGLPMPRSDEYAQAKYNGSLAPYAFSRAATTNVSSITLRQLPSPGNLATWLLNNTLSCNLVGDIQNSITFAGTRHFVSSGLVLFEGVSVLAPVGSVLTGTLACGIDANAVGFSVPMKPLPWAIRIAPCPRGSYNNTLTTCQTCPPNTYSDGGASTCTPCPGAGSSPACFDCTAGILTLKPECARSAGLGPDDTITGETELLDCSDVAKGIIVRDACITNASAGADRSAGVSHYCAPGYSGPLCAICDAAAEYAKTGQMCSTCPPTNLNYGVVAAVPFVLLVIVVYISLYRKQSAGSSTIYFRLLLTYVQTMGTLASLFMAKGTETFNAIFGSFSAVGSSPLQLSPIQCVMRLSYWVRFGGTLSIPALMTVSSILVNILSITFSEMRAPSDRRGCCVNTRSRIKDFFDNRRWLAPTLFVLNLSYASITSTSFGAFSCMARTVGRATYLKLDVSVECYTTQHLIGRIVSGIVITGLVAGLPVYFYRVLSSPAVHARLRAPGGDEALTRQLGFLFAGYSIDRGLWWESLVMSRKAFTVLVRIARNHRVDASGRSPPSPSRPTDRLRPKRSILSAERVHDRVYCRTFRDGVRAPL